MLKILIVSQCIFVHIQIARDHRIPFLETSAKSNINVEKAFLDLAQAILDKVCENQQSYRLLLLLLLDILCY